MRTSLSYDPQEPLSLLIMEKSAQGTAITLPTASTKSKVGATGTPATEAEHHKTIRIVRPPELDVKSSDNRRRRSVAALLRSFGNTVQQSVNFVYDGFLKSPSASRVKSAGVVNYSNPGIIEKSRFINERVSAAVNRASFTPKQVEALKKSLNRL